MALWILLLSALLIPILLISWAVMAGSASSDVPRPPRIVRLLGSLIPSVIAVGSPILGTGALIAAFRIPTHRWTFLALAVFLLTQGVRSALLLLSMHRLERAPALVRASYQLQGVGYAVIALLLLIASVFESPWNLVFAAVCAWLSFIYFWFMRKKFEEEE